jgi:type I restriction enzyme S subunit
VKHGIPLIRISNLVNGRVQVEEDTVFLPASFAKTNPEFLLRKGDILIAMSGATTGKTATMEDASPALLNQRVGRFLLSSAELSNSKFISFIVQQISGKVLKDAYGAAQPNISPGEIEEIPVPLPPLAEQMRIVAEIEKQFTRLEAGVAALRRVQASLKRYRASCNEFSPSAKKPGLAGANT